MYNCHPLYPHGMFLRWVLVVIMVGAAACGDSGSPPETPATTVAAQVVSMTEFRFAPDVVRVPGGGETTIILQNDGATDHNWVLLREPISSESEFSEEAVLTSTVVRPGERQTFDFAPPAAGEYQVICSIAGHFDAGMEGLLVVG